MKQKINDLALNYYKRRSIMAERATFQFFLKEGRDIYVKDTDELIYTDEFQEMYELLLARYNGDLLDSREEQAISDKIISEFY